MPFTPLPESDLHSAPESPPNPIREQAAKIHELTVVIHGNKAAADAWWRPGQGGADTFADRLESALAQRSKAHTVWQPALSQGMRCEDFGWSGKNSYGERKSAAKKLGKALMSVAHGVKATAERPLIVNVVAHSHGGSVTMHALQYLGPEVSVRNVVLMGTPLVTARATARLARLVLAPVLLTLLLLWPVLVLMAILQLLFTRISPEERIGLLLICFMPLIYGILLKIACCGADLAWRFLLRLWRLLSLHQRGEPFRLHGPSTRRMAQVLREGSILHLSTPNDEASVLLQSLAAPTEVCREMLKKCGGMIQLVERAFRSVDLFLPLVECICEKCALGVSWGRALFFDHQVGMPERCEYYPPSIYAHETITIPDAPPKSSLLTARDGRDLTAPDTIAQRMVALFEEISSQVHLWHVTYHESEFVLNRIADKIAGNRPLTAGVPVPSLTNECGRQA